MEEKQQLQAQNHVFSRARNVVSRKTGAREESEARKQDNEPSLSLLFDKLAEIQRENRE